MKTEKQKPNVGEPTGNVKVLIHTTLYGTNRTGKSVGFTVYDTTPEKLRKFFKQALADFLRSGIDGTITKEVKDKK